MAIPISIPNSEDAEDDYRSLDLLLEQLLMTLRQVIMHRRREAAANGQTIRHRRYVRRRTTPPPSTEVPEEEQDQDQETNQSVPILPDLVLDVSPDCRESRVSRQRRKDQMRETVQRPVETPESSAASQNWVQVGAELRRIADRFRATNNLDQDETDGKGTKVKDPSLLSILCPPFKGSVWTTVALLIGWGLLSRTR